MKRLINLLLLCAAPAFATVYQDGDIIFQESQSNQSKAIREATNSRWSHVGILFQNRGQWYVGEGTQPVGFISLSSFIARGKNQNYRIYRLPGLTDTQKQDLRDQVSKYVGQDYDIYFEWSDDLIYCSELVYKTFFKATGIEIGRVQKFGELRLDGPYAKALIKMRLKNTGRALDLEEPIVTPASQIEDTKLELIERAD